MSLRSLWTRAIWGQQPRVHDIAHSDGDDGCQEDESDPDCGETDGEECHLDLQGWQATVPEQHRLVPVAAT